MNVVYSEDLNESGTVMNRVAEIGGKFYPYRFSLRTAQVTRGKSFGNHSEEGVKFVSEPHKSLESAKKAL